MKVLTGKVISALSGKTAVVLVENTWQHPLYKKNVRRSRKYLVHNPVKAVAGDLVSLQESRPLSKRKRWIISKIEPRQ